MALIFCRYLAPSVPKNLSHKRSFFGDALKACVLWGLPIPLISKNSLLKPALLKGSIAMSFRRDETGCLLPMKVPFIDKNTVPRSDKIYNRVVDKERAVLVLFIGNHNDAAAYLRGKK
jgi:hypothetical protein